MLPQFKDGIYGFFGPYRFLSNFWHAWVVYDDVKYPTVEHGYQAAKTLNVDQRTAIRCAATPAIAKQIGKTVDVRPDWDRYKIVVMNDLVRQKFDHPHLRQMLLATKDKYLEETNTWGDTFWGVCNGRGLNVLGNILMDVRAEIKEQHDAFI